jgi:uncharacterized protein YhaN
MSIPHLSTEQRVQQLETTVIDLMRQVSGLTRELQAARTQQEQLQRSCNNYDYAEDHIDEVIVRSVPNLQQRVGRIEDVLEILEDDEVQPVDSEWTTRRLLTQRIPSGWASLSCTQDVSLGGTKMVFLNITSNREKLPGYHSISVLWWVTLRLLTGMGGI